MTHGSGIDEKIETGEHALPFSFLRRVVCFSVVLLAGGMLPLSVGAQEESSSKDFQTLQLPVESAAASSSSPTTNFSDLLRTVLLESLKSEYVDDRHWRGTVSRFDGFRINGTRISKREREIPHGIWHRYKVNLIRPEDNFDVQISQQSPTANGEIPFLIRIQLRARCETTFVWWTYGVKGLNGTTISDATLRLKLVIVSNPRLQFSLEKPLPSLELRPRVDDVRIELRDLDVRKFGLLEGDVVKVLGDGATAAVEVVMKQQEDKIRVALQEKLTKTVK